MDGYVILVFLLASLGLGILVIEMFIPTAGMLALLSGTCFIGAFYCAYRAWYLTDQLVWWWGYVSGFFVVVPGVLFGGLYWMPRTAFGRELFVAPLSQEELASFRDEDALLHKLFNQRAKAVTLFSPGGLVQVAGHRIHAESEGLVIDPGTDVVVVGVKGHRLVVRPVGLYDEPSKSTPVKEPDAVAPLVMEQPTKPPVNDTKSSIDFDFEIDT